MPVTRSGSTRSGASNNRPGASTGAQYLAQDTGVLSVGVNGQWAEVTGGPQSASIEDLMASAFYTGTLAAGSAGEKLVFPVFVAPFPCRVTGMAFANFGGALTLTVSNFWSFRPRRYRVSSSFSTNFDDMLSSSGTNLTLQANLLQGEVTMFNGVTWSTALNEMRTGDVLAVRMATSGSPSDLSNFLFTARYEPL